MPFKIETQLIKEMPHQKMKGIRSFNFNTNICIDDTMKIVQSQMSRAIQPEQSV